MKKIIFSLAVALSLSGASFAYAAEEIKVSTVRPEEFNVSAEIDAFIRQVVSIADRADYPINERVSLYKNPTKKVLLGISVTF